MKIKIYSLAAIFSQFAIKSNVYNNIFMNYKHLPNHQKYLTTLNKMGAENRFYKALELSAIAKALFISGLRKRFPEKTEREIKEIYLQRLAKCYNRNY